MIIMMIKKSMILKMMLKNRDLGCEEPDDDDDDCHGYNYHHDYNLSS